MDCSLWQVSLLGEFDICPIYFWEDGSFHLWTQIQMEAQTTYYYKRPKETLFVWEPADLGKSFVRKPTYDDEKDKKWMPLS